MAPGGGPRVHDARQRGSQRGSCHDALPALEWMGDAFPDRPVAYRGTGLRRAPSPPAPGSRGPRPSTRGPRRGMLGSDCPKSTRLSTRNKEQLRALMRESTTRAPPPADFRVSPRPLPEESTVLMRTRLSSLDRRTWLGLSSGDLPSVRTLGPATLPFPFSPASAAVRVVSCYAVIKRPPPPTLASLW